MRISERYRGWLAGFPEEPTEHKAMAVAAIVALEAFEEGASSDLTPLVVAASSPYWLIYQTGCSLLAHLATTCVEAQECLIQMASDKSATVRFHAVAYLNSRLPEILRRRIVQLALVDRSSKVRGKGVEATERFKFTEFLPFLVEMQRIEANVNVQKSLALHVPLLRDGFLLEPSGDGTGYYLTVRGPGYIGGPFIPMETYSEEFVREEVERLQSARPWE